MGTQQELFGEPKIESKNPWSDHELERRKKETDKIIEKLILSAASCKSKADKVNTEVSGNWTYRRGQFAAAAQRKKDTFLKWERVLRELARIWEQGDQPGYLKHVRSASDLEYIMQWGFCEPPSSNCALCYAEEYPQRAKKQAKLGIASKQIAAEMQYQIKGLAEEVITPKQQRERQLKAALDEVRKMNITGFFPTPDELIDEMIDLAEFSEGMTVLEPSAGIGSILDRIRDYHQLNVYLEAYEYQYSLAEILKLKGYKVICGDIMEQTVESGYDRIIMNPPFEKGQDIKHIMHCFNNFLKSGGRLIAIASMSWTFTSNKKSEEFRKFLNVDFDGPLCNGTKYMQKLDSSFESETFQLTASVKCNPDGAFKNAFNSTGVQTTMIVLNKKL